MKKFGAQPAAKASTTVFTPLLVKKLKQIKRIFSIFSSLPLYFIIPAHSRGTKIYCCISKFSKVLVTHPYEIFFQESKTFYYNINQHTVINFVLV